MSTPLLHSEDISAVERVCDVLASGGVVLYPTDTLYALGVDPNQEKAVAHLFSIKRRPAEKQVSYIFSNFDQVAQYAHVTDTALSMQHLLPGKFTIVLASVYDRERTVGVRIPDNSFCLALASAYGPVTATSANISGGADPHTVSDALEILSDISLAVDGGALHGPASTVVDARGDSLRVLRHGGGELHF